MSGDAEFEVRVRYLSRDGSADGCLCASGAQKGSLNWGALFGW